MQDEPGGWVARVERSSSPAASQMAALARQDAPAGALHQHAHVSLTAKVWPGMIPHHVHAGTQLFDPHLHQQYLRWLSLEFHMILMHVSQLEKAKC